jgi:hypothetical protein
MRRVVLSLVLDVVLAIVVALLLLWLWQTLLSGSLAEGFAEGARVLFYFTDIALVIWVILLAVLVIRRRTRPRFGAVILTALIGVVVNGVFVLIVGFVQGGWAPLLVLLAFEGGVALLLGILATTPLVHVALRRG